VLEGTRSAYQLLHNIEKPAMQHVNQEFFHAYLQFINDANNNNSIANSQSVISGPEDAPKADPSWHNVYPVQHEALKRAKLDPDAIQPLLVDIGGSLGHQTFLFRRTFPDLRGQCIIQDLPDVIDQAIKQNTENSQSFGKDGIKFQPQNFFEPQPADVHAAKFYLLRYILHDWDDASCIRILTNLRDAMAADSIIIIEESLLPEEFVQSWEGGLATTFDIVMWTVFDWGARERTVEEFTELVRQVNGLKVLWTGLITGGRERGIVAVGKVGA
jgi:hypothetical protein